MKHTTVSKENMKSTLWIKLFVGFLLFSMLQGCGEESKTTEQDKTDLDMIILTYTPDLEDKDRIWPDEKLKKEFTEYWYNRFTSDTQRAWKMEAPHFQFMASRQRYNNYVSSGKSQLPVHIHILEISSLGDYLYRIQVRIDFSRGLKDHSVIINDQWVNVQDNWYHIIRDPLIFPFSV